jgi:hypothetical protein
MKRFYAVECPICPLVIPHLCHQAKCPVDVGMWIANHVGQAHPELLATPDELERRRLTAQAQARRN